MPESTSVESETASEREKPKHRRAGKLIAAWFVVGIWLMILVFSPLRPLDEIIQQPRIMIFDVFGHLNLPSLIFWLVGTIVSVAIVVLGIGNLQTSTTQTNIINTPSKWMVQFIVAYTRRRILRSQTGDVDENAIQEELSQRLPMLASMQDVVDVDKMMGTSSESVTTGTDGKPTFNSLMAQIGALGKTSDVSGHIYHVVELTNGEKAIVKLDLEPKNRAGATEKGGQSVHMLLSPHDVPDLKELTPAERQALGLGGSGKGDKGQAATSTGGA